MESFVILNGVALTGVVIYMLWRRPRAGFRLRLRASRATGTGLAQQDTARGQLPLTPDDVPAWVHNIEAPPLPAEKVLNVIFNYNGHEWDAYEVFGLPAGSSMDRVEVAYQEAIAKVDEKSKPFLQTAFRAIQQKLSQEQ